MCDAVCMAQELVFGKTFDNSLRLAARGSSNPEEVVDYESIKNTWEEVKLVLRDEEVERKAKQVEEKKAQEGDGEADSSDSLAALRKGPENFAENSLPYWRSIANTHLRTYVSLYVEPTGQNALSTMVDQSALKDLVGVDGKSCVAIFLDVDHLQEAAARAERKVPLTEGRMRRLIHGALIGRGAQKKMDNEATKPKGQDVVFIHDGGRPHLKNIVACPFRLANSKTKALDSEEKVVTICYNEEVMRKRKRLIRGSEPYSLKSHLYIFSSKSRIPDVICERSRSKYPGWNVGDVLGFVSPPSSSAMWSLPRKKKVECLGARLVTEKPQGSDEAKKELRSEDPTPEPFFQNAMLPVQLVQDMFVSYSVVGFLDLAVGNGEAAKAAVQARLPYVGFCASEAHSKRFEEMLTDFVLTCLKEEGNPLYRQQCAAALGLVSSGGGDDEEKTSAAKDKETEPKEKKKQKKMVKEEKDGQGESRKRKTRGDAGGSEDGGADTKGKKKQAQKKEKKAMDEDGSDSDDSTCTW